jgi:predicted O-methyltransferase YrrM
MRRKSRQVSVAEADELIVRFGEPEAFASGYEANRVALGPSYIDYVFTVSSAEHAISLPLAAFLLTACETLEPGAVLDLGSGFSSYVLRRYAAARTPKARAVSVDDDRAWLAKTAAFLAAAELPREELVHWSEFAGADGAFDLVFYDLGTWAQRLDAVSTALRAGKPGALIVLDDLHVPAYREAVERELVAAALTPYDLSPFTIDEFGRYSWAVLT